MCANCGHAMGDHVDRCFGGWFCAPAAGTGGFVTKRCPCAGWKTMTAFEAEMAVLRLTRPWSAWVREWFAREVPWLRLENVDWEAVA